MKYSLRSLLITAMIGPPIIALVYLVVQFLASRNPAAVAGALALLVLAGRLVMVFMERFPRQP